jgi:succinate-semialdehyde dehydrogenase/glutarate-semialdehyde dehydrogenase
MIATVNPATGETVRTFPALTAAEVDGRIARADAAFRSYRGTSFADRRRWLARAAEILESGQDAFGRIMTLEMGKPIVAARQEAAKCATACRYYVEHGERLMADEPVDTGGAASFIRYQPIGAVLAVMPWNFPFWQVFRFLAPALTAGNVGLLKHASNVPQCALAIEEIVRRAGFPEDVFQTLLIGSDLVPRILEDRRVKAATLTGSEPAGRDVAARAGRAIKKTVLELGGSDPFIVTAHADLAAAARTAALARTVNSGQSCIAAKRFIVVEAAAEEFERRFVAEMEALVWATRWTSARRWVRWPRPGSWPNSRSRCGVRGGGCSPAGGGWIGPGTSTRRRCSPMCRRGRPRPARNCSARWRRCSA